MGDVYLDHMTRLPSEVERLNGQFDVMTEIMGYILHPSIRLPSNPNIADLGTGTARFLLRLHPTYPEGTMEGYDISADLYPPPSALPSNITLGVLDAKQPFPEHMLGKYDQVHVRMLVLAMLPEEWEPVVRNISTLLKPGGYLQWEECEHDNAEWLASRPTAVTEKSKYIGDMFQNALRGRLAHGYSSLPDCMRAAGLTSVVKDVRSSDLVPQIQEKSTATIANLIFTWARMVASRGTEFDGGLENLEKAVHEEIRSGCYLRYNIHVAVGRREPAA
ncbi:hypothetical protein F4802DRAFT_566316 [Xylaria palmicola]|nr:hypothetical protein F4802DRAFT_566316 [Xylaria palmicola]